MNKWRLVEAETIPEAYNSALFILDFFGDEVDCPDWGCKVIETSILINVIQPTMEPMISKLFPGGPKDLEKYKLEMLDGIMDFEVDAGKWAYTYHDRMVSYPGFWGHRDQIQFVIDELKRNPYSRRAVIDIRSDEDMHNNDPACLQNLHFQIREGKLDLIAEFRSNDAVKACFMNMFALVMLQEKIANELGVKVGSYTHIAHNFHVYEKDYDTLNNYVKGISLTNDKYKPLSQISYNYKGDWKEIMEEYDNEILKEVEDLKRRI